VVSGVDQHEGIVQREDLWGNEIASSSSNSCRLWQTLLNMLGDAGDKMAEDFAAFFRDKVESVRASTMTTPPHDVRHRLTPTLECWTPVTAAEVEKLIASAPCKTCQLDPVPTWLIKDMKSLLSPFVALLFNKSLASGHFPQDFKNAVVKSLQKKRWPGHQPDEKLQTSFKFVIHLQTFGESCTDSTTGIFGQ